MNEPITTTDQLDALPLRSVLTDLDGDLWIVMADGYLRYIGSTMTANFTVSRVLKKWGPLVLRWTPDDGQPLHPTRVLPTEDEIADALHADACPEDPDDGECCTCADYLREARIILALFAAQPTVAQVKAEAWDEGYGTGVHDERTAAEVAWPEYREPGRVNPYRTERRDHA